VQILARSSRICTVDVIRIVRALVTSAEKQQVGRSPNIEASFLSALFEALLSADIMAHDADFRVNNPPSRVARQHLHDVRHCNLKDTAEGKHRAVYEGGGGLISREQAGKIGLQIGT